MTPASPFLRPLMLASLVASLAATAFAATDATTPARLSQRLCDVLQALPEAGKARCCGSSPTGSLAGLCVRELEPSLRSGAIALDAADVERCAAASARDLAGCDWVTPYLPRTPVACRDVLHGRLDANARCRSSLECRDGLACRGGTSATPGICAPPGDVGAVCGGAADRLASSARATDLERRHPECAGFCRHGRCAAAAPVGGECSAEQQCSAGNHCASRRCVAGPPPALGEPCAGTSCGDDLVCADGRCAPPKKAGEPCTQSFECEASCLSPTADRPGTCGMKCSNWPPSGYTPPATAAR